MLDAADANENFVKGADFDTFRQDRKTVDAIVRNLEVIGEAARHVPDSVRENFYDIPRADIVGNTVLVISPGRAPVPDGRICRDEQLHLFEAVLKWRTACVVTCFGDGEEAEVFPPA